MVPSSRPRSPVTPQETSKVGDRSACFTSSTFSPGRSRRPKLASRGASSAGYAAMAAAMPRTPPRTSVAHFTATFPRLSPTELMNPKMMKPATTLTTKAMAPRPPCPRFTSRSKLAIRGTHRVLVVPGQLDRREQVDVTIEGRVAGLRRFRLGPRCPGWHCVRPSPPLNSPRSTALVSRCCDEAHHAATARRNRHGQ